jgi:hypothetical protein
MELDDMKKNTKVTDFHVKYRVLLTKKLYSLLDGTPWIPYKPVYGSDQQLRMRRVFFRSCTDLTRRYALESGNNQRSQGFRLFQDSTFRNISI